MGKRAKRRRRGVVYRNWAAIVYRSPVLIDSTEYPWERDFRYYKRHFPNYEAAIVHLTEINLGLKEDNTIWFYRSPCRIEYGQKKNGRVVSKTIQELDTSNCRFRYWLNPITFNSVMVDYNVSNYIGWAKPSRRQLRKRSEPSVPVSQNMGSKRKPWESPYPSRSSGAFASGNHAKSMVRQQRAA